jgi:hypothetical protein
VARDGRQPDPGVAGEGRELAQEVRDVALVARPAAAEDVGVDDDELVLFQH